MAEPKNKMHDKPLDKMTVTELREVAKGLPDITGASGMKKAELLEAVKAAKGIADEPAKKPAGKPKPKPKAIVTVKALKEMIKRLRVQKEEALASKDKKQAKIYRRQLSRLKKKTRRAA